MKRKFESNSLYTLGISGLIFIGFVFLVYMLLFVFVSDKNSKKSDFPILDKARLVKIVNVLVSRQDISTNGKPEITKFVFGKDEPF